MGPNSLDALCKRYGIDNSKRTRHGALLDSELLADVYLELIGGRQTALTLATAAIARPAVSTQVRLGLTRPRPLPSRLSEEERAAHGRFVDGLGSGALWKKLAD
jgi:DNA polymerase-3 subunit epsilon